jgi:hypothetical protein
MKREDHGELGHVPWLCRNRQLGLLTPENMHHTLFPANDDSAQLVHTDSLFSPFRFADTSTEFLAEMMRSTPVEQWLLQLLAAKHAEATGENRSPFADERDDDAEGGGGGGGDGPTTVPTHRMLAGIVKPLRGVISDFIITDDHPFSNRLAKLDVAVVRAIAPPILPWVDGDRAATYMFETEPRHIQRGEAGISMLLPDGLPAVRSTRLGLTAQMAPVVPERGLLANLHPTNSPAMFLHPKAGMLLTDCDKMQRLDELLLELKKGGHRVLIYSQMTKMLDLLEEYMIYRRYGFIRLDGSSKIHDRRDMVADFQNREDIFCFLLSTRAGGLGINLTAADTVIFYDSDWNPTVDQQAMDRAHRLGQTKQVTVYRMVTKDTVEERILQRAQQKSEIQKMVMTGQSKEKAAAGLSELKSSEVVSLLLDSETSQKVQQQIAKRDQETKAKKEKRSAAAAQVTGEKVAKKAKKLESEGLAAPPNREQGEWFIAQPQENQVVANGAPRGEEVVD